MGLEGVYSPATERLEGIDIIRAAFDQGITFFDTAGARMAAAVGSHGTTRYGGSNLPKPWRWSCCTQTLGTRVDRTANVRCGE
jgi:hypothetical protein